MPNNGTNWPTTGSWFCAISDQLLLPDNPHITFNKRQETHSISPNPNCSRLLILDQPRPPTPLNPSQLRIHDLLQLLQTSISFLDLLPELLTRRLTPALLLRRQVLPEKAVIDVASAMEVDQGL